MPSQQVRESKKMQHLLENGRLVLEWKGMERGGADGRWEE